MTSFQVALEVIQQATSVLAEWAGAPLPSGYRPAADSNLEVIRSKKILSWPESKSLDWLRLLFDAVKLPDSKGQNQQHYYPAHAIANRAPLIPYPLKQPPTLEDQAVLEMKEEVKKILSGLDDEDWQNLSLLTLILEKFGSCLSFGEPDVALIDMARTTGAIAAALASDPQATELSLVAGDLSGIQKFIYTISSDGALKSLRARSFYLELVTEEVVQQLLAALGLPRINIIYAGGGNLYLLAAATDKTKKAVSQVCQQFNKWLLDEFQCKVFLALDYLPFPIEHVANKQFAVHWSDITKQLAGQKARKFADQVTTLIKPRESHEPCRVCHRDDVETLRSLNNREPDSVLACHTCRNMFHLGGQLLRVKAIMRSSQKQIAGASPLHTLSFELPATAQLAATTSHYHLFPDWKQIVLDSDTVFLVNDWTVKHYQFRHFRNPVPMLLGNYGKPSQNSGSSEEPVGFMRTVEMVEQAQGIPRIGYLRMDVDRLGQVFAKGLGKNQTLPRLAALSRQMSYFFKVYLNSLAGNRLANLPKPSEIAKCLTQEHRANLVFIYAGGDDLFVSGAWNEVVEFAFDVYQCFRVYTGKNPDITLSGGISLADIKFPLYQAADESGDAEDAAKGNGRDSLSLFGQVFKWDEWLGIEDIAVIDEEIRKYLSIEIVPELFGIFPFVKRLNQLEINYSRNFIHNLLITAQVQEQMIKEIKDKSPDYRNALRYYLHLPKVAYTLARLPLHVREQENFIPVRTSLKSPYNAPYFRAIATWLELLNR